MQICDQTNPFQDVTDKAQRQLSVPIGNHVWTQTFFERFGLDEMICAFKTKGTDLTKLIETMVAYKVGDNFSILRCYEFIMQRPIRKALTSRSSTCAANTAPSRSLGRNKKPFVTAFRQRFLSECGPKITDTVFDWTSLVYFGNRPEKTIHEGAFEGRPSEGVTDP